MIRLTTEDDSKLSNTSARVGLPVYNTYEKNELKVFGYYDGKSQYDPRLTGDFETPGRGRDLMNVSAFAYDTIIISSLGIVGDKGEEKDKINNAAKDFGIKECQPTFTDSWGDILSYTNVGFDEWTSGDASQLYQQQKCQGLLGGLAKMKKKNPDLNISIGGREMSEAYHSLVKDPSKRESFVSGVKDIFNRFPMINGINLDWVYPNYENKENSYGPEDVENFSTLIREVRAALGGMGRGDITIAIACPPFPDAIHACGIPLLMEAGASFINLMAFDFFGCPWSDSIKNHCNLKSSKNNVNSIENSVSSLIELGVPSKSIFIGYCAYSRNAPNAYIKSISPLAGEYELNGDSIIGTFESGKTEYYDIINNYLDFETRVGRNGFKLYTDTKCDADFLYNEDSKVFMSIDTPRSVKAKGEFVVNNNLGGMFALTIDMDHGLLVNAAREGLGALPKNESVDMSNFYFNGTS
ncbi:hypothetical protein ACTA71_011056 [Dictyostelium dimigraforme]